MSCQHYFFSLVFFFLFSFSLVGVGVEASACFQHVADASIFNLFFMFKIFIFNF